MSSPRYAIICENGHVIRSFEDAASVDKAGGFCRRCGGHRVYGCEKCKAKIPGGVFRIRSVRFTLPHYCYGCGEPYPWTTKKIKAALEFFAEELNDKFELESIEKGLNALAANTPDAKLAWYRIDKQIARLADPAKNLAYDLTVSVMSEVAKEALLPKTK